MSNPRILVVEDEKLTCLTLSNFLQEAGYTTASAYNGKSAVVMHQADPFDLCIVDIRMPGMDGIETVLALHHIHPPTHFIIYTGSPGFTLPQSLKQAGITEHDIVYKPVPDMNIFADLVHQKLSQRQEDDETA